MASVRSAIGCRSAGHSAILTAAGGVLAQSLTGLNLDERFSATVSGVTESYLADALGSTVALANAAGSLPTTCAYSPFGSQRAHSRARSVSWNRKCSFRAATGNIQHVEQDVHPDVQSLRDSPLANCRGLKDASILYGLQQQDEIRRLLEFDL